MATIGLGSDNGSSWIVNCSGFNPAEDVRFFTKFSPGGVPGFNPGGSILVKADVSGKIYQEGDGPCPSVGGKGGLWHFEATGTISNKTAAAETRC
jgi:hypothetical protein